MKLYVNGCSHTRGLPESLAGDLKLAYPYLLQEHWDASLDNLSATGSSNDRIFRETIEYINSNTPDLIVIQWTFHERMELNVGDETSRRFQNFVPCAWAEKEEDGKLKEFFISLSDRWYGGARLHPHRTRYSDTSITHKALNYTYTLQELFKVKNLNYKFIMWSGVDESYPIYNLIDKSRCIFSAEHLLSLYYERHHIDNHYGVDAHQEIADWIITDFHHPNVRVEDKNYTIYDYTD